MSVHVDLAILFSCSCFWFVCFLVMIWGKEKQIKLDCLEMFKQKATWCCIIGFYVACMRPLRVITVINKILTCFPLKQPSLLLALINMFLKFGGKIKDEDLLFPGQVGNDVNCTFHRTHLSTPFTVCWSFWHNCNVSDTLYFYRSIFIGAAAKKHFIEYSKWNAAVDIVYLWPGYYV